MANTYNVWTKIPSERNCVSKRGKTLIDLSIAHAYSSTIGVAYCRFYRETSNWSGFSGALSPNLKHWVSLSHHADHSQKRTIAEDLSGATLLASNCQANSMYGIRTNDLCKINRNFFSMDFFLYLDWCRQSSSLKWNRGSEQNDNSVKVVFAFCLSSKSCSSYTKVTSNSTELYVIYMYIFLFSFVSIRYR